MFDEKVEKAVRPLKNSSLVHVARKKCLKLITACFNIFILMYQVYFVYEQRHLGIILGPSVLTKNTTKSP